MKPFFDLKKNNTTIKTEIVAGITTFFTMAYIIFVNPHILSMPLFIQENPDAELIKNSIFTATCISAALGTIIMALYARLPFAQAPGMGLNAFFAFTIVLTMGYTFYQALAIVFITGILFIFINIIGLRKQIIKAIPSNIRLAITVGIGIFIALIGFINAGIITGDEVTLVKMIDFSKHKTDPMVNSALITFIGLIFTGILMAYKTKGAIFIGIIFTTIIGIPFGQTIIPENIMLISTPPSLAPTFMKMDFSGLFASDNDSIASMIFTTITLLISFTLVDLFDSIGSLIGVGQKTGLIDKKGNLLRMNKALMADAIATATGACLGTSTVTTYIESGAGVAEGGKTGLTSLTTAILFLLALFFAPLLGIVPASATAPALIIVGVLMINSVAKIEFNDITEALPAFLTIVLIPFTYSISTGIAAGIISYPIMKLFKGKYRDLHPIIWILAILFVLHFIVLHW